MLHRGKGNQVHYNRLPLTMTPKFSGVHSYSSSVTPLFQSGFRELKIVCWLQLGST